MSKEITEAPKGLGKKKEAKFQYKSLKDPKYLKDKKEFLREGGNGWWIGVGLDKRSTQRKHAHNRRKKLNKIGSR